MARLQASVMNAFGRFAVNIAGEEYAFRKLVLLDQSCILESLGMIYWYILNVDSQRNTEKGFTNEEWAF